jgi:hypothetical protein
MISDIYKIEGKYPDPYEIERELEAMRRDPNREHELIESLSELKGSGFNSHPLLGRFFVES